VIFKSVPSSTVAIAQLRAGEVQAMWNILESETVDLEKDASVKLQVVPGPSVERIEMNTVENKDMADPSKPHPVLSDINVRRALIYATPKQQIIDKLLFGKAKVGTSPVSQGWASPKDVTQESYDPKKANELLDKAGWTKGADGIRAKGGVRASLTITTTTGNSTREKVEQVLIDEYRQIGVELKIKNEPSSVLLSGSWAQGDQRKRGSFDLIMYASSPDIDPHQTVSQRYTSKNIPSTANNGTGQNYTRVKNAEMDAAVEEAGSTLDFDKRKAAYAKALKLLNQEAVIIWLYDRANIDGRREGLEGWKPHPWQGFTWNIQEWSLKK
jgi:peptide/nickel transport system substrate-binding protein